MPFTTLTSSAYTTLDATKLTGNLPAISGASLTGVGITVARQFRLTTGFTGNANPITSNWEEVDTDGYGGLGTVNQSSGIFSFGSTGIYLVEFRALHQFDQADAYTNVFIETTTNNSTYNNASISNIGLNSGYHHFATCSHVFDVTDVSTHKVRVGIFDANAGNGTKGDSNNNQTTVTFIRLGDT